LTKILSFIVKINAKKKHCAYTCITLTNSKKTSGSQIYFKTALFFPSTYDISQDFDTSHIGLGNQNYFLIQTLRNVTTLYAEVVENKFCKFYSIKFIVII